MPESQTDFIFSVLGEELGFVGAIFVLLLFLLCLGRLLRIILGAPDDFGAFLTLGVFAVILIQMTVNIGMNVDLLPVTGITLPFVSYGASALVIFLAEIGLALSVSRNA